MHRGSRGWRRSRDGSEGLSCQPTFVRCKLSILLASSRLDAKHQTLSPMTFFDTEDPHVGFDPRFDPRFCSAMVRQHVPCSHVGVGARYQCTVAATRTHIPVPAYYCTVHEMCRSDLEAAVRRYITKLEACVGKRSATSIIDRPGEPRRRVTRLSDNALLPAERPSSAVRVRSTLRSKRKAG
jgi:hypothetical protein